MRIPCTTCQRPNECVRDRRCNRPSGVSVALKEFTEAIAAFHAATARLNAATAAVEAACAAEKDQGA